mgnify:CR=1 FL=1
MLPTRGCTPATPGVPKRVNTRARLDWSLRFPLRLMLKPVTWKLSLLYLLLFATAGCMPKNRTAKIPTSGVTPTLALPTTPLTNVPELLAKAIAARGGEKALRKLSTVSYQGTGKTAPGNVVSNMVFRNIVALPDRLRDETDYENGTKFVQAIQQGKGWMSINGVVRDIDQINQRSMAESLHVNQVLTLLPLRDPRFKLEPLPEKRREGTMTVGFVVRCENEREVTLCFDQETSLPLLCKSKVIDANLGSDHDQEIFFYRYEAVEGLQFPRRWMIYTDGQLSMELNYESIKFLEKVDDILFAKP